MERIYFWKLDSLLDGYSGELHLLKSFLFNRDLNRGCLVYVFSLRFSWSTFLLNLRRQFRVHKIFFVHLKRIFVRFAIIGYFRLHQKKKKSDLFWTRLPITGWGQRKLWIAPALIVHLKRALICFTFKTCSTCSFIYCTEQNTKQNIIIIIIIIIIIVIIIIITTKMLCSY